MANWLDTYKNEEVIIQRCIENKDIKFTPPVGYVDTAFNDLDDGNYKILKEADITESQKRRSKMQNYELKEFKKKKMWELATSPAKSILMNVGMSYMSPNDIQVIPIMMLFMLFINTFKEMFAMNEKFSRLDTSIDSEIDAYDLNIMKFVYFISCCGNLGVGVWKLNSMGLIPNRQSDWLGWESKLLSKENFV